MRKAFDEVEFHNWKEVVSVNVGDRFTPHTAVIEKSPLYKVTYDLMTQIFEFSAESLFGELASSCRGRIVRDSEFLREFRLAFAAAARQIEQFRAVDKPLRFGYRRFEKESRERADQPSLEAA